MEKVKEKEIIISKENYEMINSISEKANNYYNEQLLCAPNDFNLREMVSHLKSVRESVYQAFGEEEIIIRSSDRFYFMEMLKTTKDYCEQKEVDEAEALIEDIMIKDKEKWHA